MSLRFCWSCNALDLNKDSKRLQKCSQCKLVVYCNRKCQRKDWKQFHKYHCKNYKIMGQKQPQQYKILQNYYRFIQEIVNNIRSEENNKTVIVNSTLFPFVTLITDYLPSPYHISLISTETIKFPTANPWFISPSDDVFALVGQLDDVMTRQRWDSDVVSTMTFEEHQQRQTLFREKTGQMFENLYIPPSGMFDIFRDCLFNSCQRASWIKMKQNAFEPQQNVADIYEHQIEHGEISMRVRFVIMDDDHTIFMANSWRIQYFQAPHYTEMRVLGEAAPHFFVTMIKLWRQQSDVFAFCQEASELVLYKIQKEKNQNDYVLLSILSLKDNDFRKVQISNDLSDASLWITDVLFIDSATFIMWINGKQFITKGNGCIFEEIAFPEIYRENEEKMTVLNTYYYTKRNALISLVRNDILIELNCGS
eukprot:104872_1